MASIRKRGENSYQITISTGYDCTGKKLIKQKTVSRPTGLTEKQWEKELEKIALEFEIQVEKGTILDGSKLTFAEFCEKWIRDYAETNLEKRTVANYKEMLSKRIIPALGHIKLDKLQPNNLLEFYNNLSEGGMRLDYKYIAKPEFINLMEKNTFQEVSELSKVQPETISKIVKGKPCMSFTVDKICDSLKIKKDKYFIALDQKKDPFIC